MVETPRLQARRRAWDCGRVFATTTTSWCVLSVTRGMIVSGLKASAPRVLLQEPHLRGTSAGEPVVEPGSKAVGTGSVDVADGVVRKARRGESPCAAVNFQLTATKPPACRRWLLTRQVCHGRLWMGLNCRMHWAYSRLRNWSTPLGHKHGCPATRIAGRAILIVARRIPSWRPPQLVPRDAEVL